MIFQQAESFLSKPGSFVKFNHWQCCVSVAPTGNTARDSSSPSWPEFEFLKWNLGHCYWPNTPHSSQMDHFHSSIFCTACVFSIWTPPWPIKTLSKSTQKSHQKIFTPSQRTTTFQRTPTYQTSPRSCSLPLNPDHPVILLTPTHP